MGINELMSRYTLSVELASYRTHGLYVEMIVTLKYCGERVSLILTDILTLQWSIN